MNSIDAMVQDVRCQLEDLPALALPELAENSVAFVGSGDSYAAALAACYLSSGCAACWHPSDVISNPLLVACRSVYFVSISGKSRANIRAATAARDARITTFALTADAKSPLARACDRVIELDFNTAGKTAGTIAFAASLLACTHLATQGRIRCPSKLSEIYAKASKAANRSIRKAHTNSAIILGDSFLFPAAIYCALKFNEVFGFKAQASPLEEFFHAQLFGLKRSDQVIVLGAKGDAALARRVNAMFVDCSSYAAPVESLFYAIFFVQHFVLAIAKKKKMKECYFLRNNRLLKASSDIIY